MSKTFLGDFRMDSGEQQLRRMSVAQVMEPHLGKILNSLSPLIVQTHVCERLNHLAN